MYVAENFRTNFFEWKATLSILQIPILFVRNFVTKYFQSSLLLWWNGHCFALLININLCWTWPINSKAWWPFLIAWRNGLLAGWHHSVLISGFDLFLVTSCQLLVTKLLATTCQKNIGLEAIWVSIFHRSTVSFTNRGTENINGYSCGMWKTD